MADPFLTLSRHYLQADYLPKIERCLDLLGTEDLWWRPNEHSNSAGNLILHLAGNVRQWIMHGVGGATDVRRRQIEFNERSPIPGTELKNYLRTTLAEADRVLTHLDPARLDDPITLQGNEVTVRGAIYHVVEHFAMHTGQIIYITKQRTDTDLGFYRIHDDGTAEPQW